MKRAIPWIHIIQCICVNNYNKLQQQQKQQRQQPTEVKLFTQWKKHVFFNTQINTYGCVHDCVSLCVFLSRIYFYSIIILCNQKQITNSRRAGDRQNGRKWEWQHTSMRISTMKCAPLFTEAAERQSRRTVPHGHLLNYSLRQGREEHRVGGALQSQMSPSLKLDWLYRKLAGPKKINVAEAKLSDPSCRLFFYMSKRKFATVFRILFA